MSHAVNHDADVVLLYRLAAVHQMLRPKFLRPSRSRLEWEGSSNGKRRLQSIDLLSRDIVGCCMHLFSFLTQRSLPSKTVAQRIGLPVWHLLSQLSIGKNFSPAPSLTQQSASCTRHLVPDVHMVVFANPYIQSVAVKTIMPSCHLQNHFKTTIGWFHIESHDPCRECKLLRSAFFAFHTRMPAPLPRAEEPRRCSAHRATNLYCDSQHIIVNQNVHHDIKTRRMLLRAVMDGRWYQG